MCGSCSLRLSFFLCHSFAVPSDSFTSPACVWCFPILCVASVIRPWKNKQLGTLGRLSVFLPPLSRVPMTEGRVCVCDSPDFFFFCTSFFAAPFIRALIHSSFKPAFKVFFVVLPKPCAKQWGWNNSYGNRDAFGCNTAGCSPSTSLPLCSKEFPERAAGERDTLPARCLVPLAFSRPFSLFVCRAAVFFFVFFFKSTFWNSFFFF